MTFALFQGDFTASRMNKKEPKRAKKEANRNLKNQGYVKHKTMKVMIQKVRPPPS